MAAEKIAETGIKNIVLSCSCKIKWIFLSKVTVVNERQREHEQSEKMFEILKKIIAPAVSVFDIFISNHSKVLIQSFFTKTKTKSCEILSPTRRFVAEGDAKLVSTAMGEVIHTGSSKLYYYVNNIF